MFFIDPMYFVYALPALLLGLWAQFSLHHTFGEYSQVATRSGVDGQTAAQEIMRATGVRVGVRSTPGFLTDYYDPSDRSINLSESSTQGSIASVAVVAHEMGHAVQDAQGYGPMRARSAIVPAVQIGSWLGPILFIAGLWLQSASLAWVGVAAFAGAAIFALLTLPVEFDASRRGLELLQQTGVLAADELVGARKVLTAAALTYVAAAAQALSNLLYYASILTRRQE